MIDEKLRRIRHGRGANDRRRLAHRCPRGAARADSRRQLQAIRLRLGLKRHSGSQLPLMGALERRKPLAFADGLKQLIEKTGLPEQQCNAALAKIASPSASKASVWPCVDRNALTRAARSWTT